MTPQVRCLDRTSHCSTMALSPIWSIGGWWLAASLSTELWTPLSRATFIQAALRFPRALILLPLGMLIVWLGNALRNASLMYVGGRIDREIAIENFHSKPGWFFFAAITLATTNAARRASAFTQPEKTESYVESYNMAAPLLLPLLTLIGVGLVTSMFSSHYDPLDGVKLILESSDLCRDIRCRS